MRNTSWATQPRTPAPQNAREGERIYKERLSVYLGEYTGDFDTERRCICAKANITARVSAEPLEEKPYHDPADPMPALKRTYLCTRCGILYDASVIEGVRGYTPKQPQ